MPASLRKSKGRNQETRPFFAQGCNHQDLLSRVTEFPCPNFLDHQQVWTSRHHSWIIQFHDQVDGLSIRFPLYTENPLPAGNFVSVGGRVYLSANQRNEKLTLAKNCNGNGVFPSGQMRISPLSWLIWTSVPPTPSENPSLLLEESGKMLKKAENSNFHHFQPDLVGRL